MGDDTSSENEEQKEMALMNEMAGVVDIEGKDQDDDELDSEDANRGVVDYDDIEVHLEGDDDDGMNLQQQQRRSHDEDNESSSDAQQDED